MKKTARIGAGLPGFVVVSLWSAAAFAGGSGMPWETTLRTIQQSIEGPVVNFAAVVACVVFGLTFALGEGGGGFRRGFGILFGLSIAFTASTMLLPMLGWGNGALM